MRPFRGAGRPEAAAAIERAMDLFAAEIEMDPPGARRNLLAATCTRTARPAGRCTTSGLTAALDMALEASDYAGLRAEQVRRRERGTPATRHRLSVYVRSRLGGGGESVRSRR